MTNGTAVRDSDRLYQLLPIIYRERDREAGYPLRALLKIVAALAGELQDDIGQLYADHFIETCQDWAVPYLGDLVSNDLLYDANRLDGSSTAGELFGDLAGAGLLRPRLAVRARVDVANTVHYRRRKGTLSAIEALARDVTGWSARAVELRELLATTQDLDHRRPAAAAVDVRAPDLAELLGGPFDTSSRSAELRSSTVDAAPNLQGVAVYLWRLQAFPLPRVPARRAGPAWRYRFSQLGRDAPLFQPARAPGGDGSPAGDADVAGPLRQVELCEDLARFRTRRGSPEPAQTELYGPQEDASLYVYLNGTGVPPDQVECARLDPWPRGRPEGRVVLIDAETGRLVLGDGWRVARSVEVGCWYGFSGALGGGTYDRRRWLIAGDPPDLRRIHVSASTAATGADGSVAAPFPDVPAALAAWTQAGRPDAVVTIEDSGLYQLPPQLQLAATSSLAIEAADRARPVLQTTTPSAGRRRRRNAPEVADRGLLVLADAPVQGRETEAELTLSGVVLEGHLEVAGALRRLRLLHTTLVPRRRLEERSEPAVAGPPSLVVSGARGSAVRNAALRVEIAFSITGALLIPEDAIGLWLLDSIVDGCGGAALRSPGGPDRDGPPAWLERATVLGPAFVKELTMATDVIFTGPLTADRTQQGCARFSYLPSGSITPQRYRCQPDLAIEDALRQAANPPGAQPVPLHQADRAALASLAERAVVPVFTSLDCGLPAYGQLRHDVDSAISSGAEDGAEMGAFNFLKQPQRDNNLRTRLAEYLPLGFDPQIIYVT